MQSHVVDYQIIGESTQMVEVTLDPGETVIAEAGAMAYMDQHVKFETRMSDGSNPDEGMFGKLISAGKRALTGESIAITHFTNEGGDAQRVAFCGPYPGQVIPMDLSELGGELLCQSDAFLCAAKGTSLDVALNKRIGSGLFGEGFILQRLAGDGLTFLHAGGNYIRKDLNNERMRIDTGCIVAFTPSLDYSIERAGGVKSMLFGGEGLVLTTVEGTGSVWLQSLPFPRLVDYIVDKVPRSSNND